ncbi:hypothetical protein M758_2G229700 [Ceratodon purpureus]|uniref:Uncharacterized protein n=1 Tax=Ceratodon purpureus TaxID=3225 RepID=A0A8T0J1J7_CERPU|nr:hypothetical protein KC19_2G275800 [Ceratodon purpureus]KAG0627810.1 hypothetical protein M758_2G229700 [Ceratodon purpureus]
MAPVRWPGAQAQAQVQVQVLVLLLSCFSLCFVHGRVLPADLDLLARDHLAVDELGSGFVLPIETESFDNIGEVLRRGDGGDSDRQSEDRSISVYQGQKWKRALAEIAEWTFHACVVVLAVFAIYYTIACICACCIGLDLLAQIWRTLGGWQAFYYFVHVEQAVVEPNPESSPLLRTGSSP